MGSGGTRYDTTSALVTKLLLSPEACDKNTFDYLQTHRLSSPNDAADDAFTSRDATPFSIEESSSALSEAAEDSGDEDTFRIKLQSTLTKPVTLTVRQSTKCSAVINAFLRHHNLSDKYTSPRKGQKTSGTRPTGPALVVDGDRLNPDDELSVADLEDGDMVEVVGL